MAAKVVGIVVFLAICLLLETTDETFVGGIQRIDIHQENIDGLYPGLMHFIEIAVEKAGENITNESNIKFVADEKTIIVSEQLVAGVLYRVNAIIGPASLNCIEGTHSLCDLDTSDEGYRSDLVRDCSITIWSRVWLKDPAERLKIEIKSCKPR